MASKKSPAGTAGPKLENPHPKSKSPCPNCPPDSMDMQTPISKHMPKGKSTKKGKGY